MNFSDSLLLSSSTTLGPAVPAVRSAEPSWAGCDLYAAAAVPLPAACISGPDCPPAKQRLMLRSDMDPDSDAVQESASSACAAAPAAAASGGSRGGLAQLPARLPGPRLEARPACALPSRSDSGVSGLLRDTPCTSGLLAAPLPAAARTGAAGADALFARCRPA